VYIQSEGPFDGVVGFSRGAGMALMYMIRQAHLDPVAQCAFKVLILSSRIGVYDPTSWLESGEAYILERLPLGIERLKVSVAAIWGNKDWDAVHVEGRTTKAFVEEGMIWEFVHDGAHEVPGASVQGSVRGAVKVIRRAVTQATIMNRDN
jgi:hypothetical protein